VAAPRYDTVTANSRMQRLGDGVKLSLRQHRKQPCHSAFISSRGEVVYVCTDRNRHAGEAGSGVLDLKAERAAKRAVVKELRDAQPVRAAALKDALANGAIGTDEAVQRAARHLLDPHHHARTRASHRGWKEAAHAGWLQISRVKEIPVEGPQLARAANGGVDPGAFRSRALWR